MNREKRRKIVIGIVCLCIWTAGTGNISFAGDTGDGKSEGSTSVNAYVVGNEKPSPEEPSQKENKPEEVHDKDKQSPVRTGDEKFVWKWMGIFLISIFTTGMLARWYRKENE